MPLDRQDLEELQESALQLSYQAVRGDDAAFREFCEAASVLNSYGLKAPCVSRASVDIVELARA